MATIAVRNPTILDVAKSLDPNGSVATTIELLSQTNEILKDMVWIMGNLPTGNQTTIRTGLPSPTWRKLYQGVQPTKSTRAQITDTCGMLEARTEVDCDAVKLANDPNAFRLSEAAAHLEGMNQELSRAIFYETATTNPERITGLAPRYSSLSAGNAQNIISAGGAGADNTSVWLICWGENTIAGIYPKNNTAGLTHRDLGEIDAFDTQTPPARFRAYADLWQWKAGLMLKDWRYAVRIANIDVSDLVGATGTQAAAAATLLIKLMIRAMARIPAMGMGRPVFYANRTVKEYLSIQALDRNQNVLSFAQGVDQFGAVRPGSVNGDLLFQGVPVRTVDQITNAETVVS